MARLRIYGGIGSIGSSKLAVEQDGWRVLFDLGLAIPGREGLLRGGVRLQEGRQLARRLALGEAPAIEHLYRQSAIPDGDLVGGDNGRTALFLSHCHIDHVGLIGWVDPGVPVRASEETVRMIDALEESGGGVEGARPKVEVCSDGEEIHVGPLVVERVSVDHDVPGASGYLVHTDDGIVAYTGDFRLHGRHPERTERFAARATGAAALVTEGTTLSGDPRVPFRSEEAVDRSYGEALAVTPGLVLQSIYPRDIDRVESLTAIAARFGRSVLWPADVARFLDAYGLRGMEQFDRSWLEQVRAKPSGFVVQLSMAMLDVMFDLPLGPGSLYLHANGEPLGPFVPEWDLLQDWLRYFAVPFRSIGSSGHASPGDLHRFVEAISPKTVYPVHTADPYRLLPPSGTRRVLPEHGRWYPVAAPVLARPFDPAS